MNDFIDVYCERLGPGLLAEPLNALSNLVFFIAAFFAGRLARREGAFGVATYTLLGLLLMIGIGSTLFHTFATRWAALSDTLPILFFQLTFLIAYTRNIIKLPTPGVLLMLGLYIGTIMAVAAVPRGTLNGSVSYLPALLFIGGLGLWHWRAGKAAPYALIAATLIFAISVTFRSLDIPICPHLPIGVHYIWHLLNGCVLYLCMVGYLRNARTFDGSVKT